MIDKGYKIYFLITSLAIAIGLIYIGAVFYMRSQENRDIQEKAAAIKRTDNKNAVDMLGGNRFEIVTFYAAPGAINRGDSSDLCYGVTNAKSVSLDPPSGEMWPSLDRCFQVSPKKTTTYTLTATDASGQTKTATVTLTCTMACSTLAFSAGVRRDFSGLR